MTSLLPALIEVCIGLRIGQFFVFSLGPMTLITVTLCFGDRRGQGEEELAELLLKLNIVWR